jgi:hypothetical protein
MGASIRSTRQMGAAQKGLPDAVQMIGSVLIVVDCGDGGPTEHVKHIPKVT